MAGSILYIVLVETHEHRCMIPRTGWRRYEPNAAPAMLSRRRGHEGLGRVVAALPHRSLAVVLILTASTHR